MTAILPFYPLAVRLAVTDVPGAVAFLRDVLGFEQRRQGDGWSAMENGALVLHVVAGEPGEPGAELELVADDFADAAATLLRSALVSASTPATRRTPERQEQRFRGPHGLRLVLVRNYNEDELGVPPPLPTALVWPDDTVPVLQDLLRQVPLAFRADARRRSVAAAETRALARGAVEVDLVDVATGLLLATPQFRRPEVAALLCARGLRGDASVAVENA